MNLSFIYLNLIISLLFYNLQNLVSNTFHSLDSRVTVFLVNIMKSNDRNLIFVADLFYRDNLPPPSLLNLVYICSFWWSSRWVPGGITLRNEPLEVEYESPRTATVCFTCAMSGMKVSIMKEMINVNLFMMLVLVLMLLM